MQENKNYKKEEKYYPMLVPINYGRTDKDDEFLNLWERFRSLQESKKNIVSSDKLVDFIYGASQRYNLDETKTEEFSRTVRQYFFNEIQDGQFARKIAELCNTSNEEGLEILNSIKNIQPEFETETKRNLITGQTYTASKQTPTVSRRQTTRSQMSSTTTPQVSNIVQIPVRKALKLYPKLESQTLTQNPIISKPFLKPVKPTIKNWLTIYEELMGAGKKGAIDRGNFLFHSEATKNLPTEERQKLAQVFKSADENLDLKIDTIKGEIIFSVVSDKKKYSGKNLSDSSIEKSFDKNKSSDKFDESIFDGKFEKKLEDNFVSGQFKKSVNTSQKTFQPQQKVANNPVLDFSKLKPKFKSESDVVSQENYFQKLTPDNSLSQKNNVFAKNPQSFVNDRNSKTTDASFQSDNFINQGNDNLNNFSVDGGVEKVSCMGNDSFDVPKQEGDSLISLDNSDEESMSFSSSHVLPIEKKE